MKRRACNLCRDDLDVSCVLLVRRRRRHQFVLSDSVGQHLQWPDLILCSQSIDEAEKCNSGLTVRLRKHHSLRGAFCFSQERSQSSRQSCIGPRPTPQCIDAHG